MSNRFVSSFAFLVCIALTAEAGLRGNMDSSRYFNPEASEKMRDNFTPGPVSPFRIGGGVFLQGNAAFFLEKSGATTAVAPEEMELVYDSGSVTIGLKEDRFPLDMHEGLACPLSRMIMRGGELAYSQSYSRTDAAADALKKAGLVALGDDILQKAVAQEFAGTIFEELVKGADFGETVPLPNDERIAAIAAISERAGLRFLPQSGADRGRYMNTDAQVTYQVFLVDDGVSRVDIGGLPLRYYWHNDPLNPDAAIISDVELFSVEGITNGGPRAFDDGGGYAAFGQYDYILLHQVAGIFRTLAASNPNTFGVFSEAACEDYQADDYAFDNSGICLPSSRAAELGTLALNERPLVRTASVLQNAFYRFQLDTPTRLEVTAANPIANPKVALFSETGDYLAGNDDASVSNLNANLMSDGELEPGTYCVAVSALESVLEPITLFVSRLEPVEPVEVDLGRLEENLQAMLQLNGDRGTVSFETTQAEEVEITAQAIGAGDPTIELFSNEGAFLGANDDHSWLDSRLVISLQPGAYTLEVREFDDAPMNVEVTINEITNN